MKKFDKIIIVALIAVAVVSGVVIKVNSNRKYDQKYAEIKVEGKLYKKVSLDKSKKKQTIDIKTGLGENIVEVENGGVRIIDADCPDEICIKDGFKDKPGDVLVCLPHKVVIEIKGVSDNSKVDIISQ
ncbi:NusG domain II-containing protein [Clostridium bovifaecis]|uniref:NusG domain II-containing protein n=1 Tax=Clostridium bovifaecis TaxID=2184719 RepID=A0A6I6EN36_9CLOT|nr:NusG domain II-containing protein [Clostridium bovifaecis]